MEELNKAKIYISEKEWQDKLSTYKFQRKDLDKLIMNFFMVEGYIDAAEKFSKESGIECKIYFIQYQSLT